MYADIAADVALLAQQRDEARAEIEHLRSQLSEAEDIASRLRTEVAEERRNFEDWALEFRRHQPVVQAARRWRVTAGPATAPGPDLRPPDAWKAADDLIAAVDVFDADRVVEAIRGALDATIAEETQAGYYATSGIVRSNLGLATTKQILSELAARGEAIPCDAASGAEMATTSRHLLARLPDCMLGYTTVGGHVPCDHSITGPIDLTNPSASVARGGEAPLQITAQASNDDR